MTPMRLALHLSAHGGMAVAETELARRMVKAAACLGWMAETFTGAEAIRAWRADAVLAMHHFVPKLTELPTFGCLWNPPRYFQHDVGVMRNILSYDGHLVASASIRRFVGDLFHGTGRRPVIGEIQTSTWATPDLAPVTPGPKADLFYSGTNWDGQRLGPLFDLLSRLGILNAYGPPERWQHLPGAYAGALAFDGASFIDAARSHGIGLCLHTGPHRADAVANMRAFELAAAGVVVISDRHPFIEAHYGDSVLYVDTDCSLVEIGRQIVAHVGWVRDHPEAAAAKAAAAQAIFNRDLSLEHYFAHLPDLVDTVRRDRRMVAVPRTPERPAVDYIVRVGGRPADVVAGALESLADQTHADIGAVLVGWRPVAGLDEVCNRLGGRLRRITKVAVPNTGLRSTALWAGVAAVTAPLFGILDDDDRLHPNHVALLVDRLVAPEVDLAYAGGIRVAADDPECRHLAHLEPVDFARMWRVNYVTSNAWLARTALCDLDVLVDPELEVGEDVVLLLELVARARRVVPSWSPTSEFHWRAGDVRSTAADWRQAVARRIQRLMFHERFGGFSPYDWTQGTLDWSRGGAPSHDDTSAPAGGAEPVSPAGAGAAGP